MEFLLLLTGCRKVLGKMPVFIQPINVSELSEVDCKSIVQLLIVSKVLGGLNHWK